MVVSQNQPDRKRAQVTATFEVLPRLLGFNEDVVLRGVNVDYTRYRVSFYLVGPGLAEYEEDGVDYTSLEGQESPEIIPPAWL